MTVKLRNRILILCMAIALSVILLSYFIIYTVMSQRISAENRKDLTAAADVLNQEEYEPGKYKFWDESAFAVFADSWDDESTEAVGELASVAGDSIQDIMSKRSTSGTLKIDKTTYMYVAKEAPDETGGKIQITFLNISDSREILRRLLDTFAVLGVIAVVAIFLVSRYIANLSIKPVTDALMKQRRFVSDASHELKTPLAMIMSNYDVIVSDKEKTVESQGEWLGYMKAGMDRMLSLIDDMLALSRTESVALCEPYNISNEIKVEAKKFEAQLNIKSVSLNCHIDDGVMIVSDKSRLSQVFDIILDNAIKHVDEGGRIEVSLKQKTGKVICTVGNSGSVIEKADMPKIFDRFYRADTSRSSKTGGHGLGLSIAKAILESLGGEISCSSQSDWTEFSFVLSNNQVTPTVQYGRESEL